ncbi:MAG: IS110 family transposase [Euryarchaeota archaeon]|nr:IS110 family transposase [Euryarchaeota archaeon]MDE1836945.1 IS110 family transposase [Euryarchaeota archaeon]MDE1881906.1 IS110 family transposase [Euryarchaeota archaeon]MDE2045870.1 IS110 family transposase [Thermoplasmata archaeon]
MWKTTFVGLDVSRKTIMATAVDELGHRIDQRKLTARDPELVEFLAGLPGEKKVVLEACNVWEHVYDAAASTGAQVKLANPLKTRIITEASLKTDRVDSEALAMLARLDAVAEAYAPTPEQRALRHLVRERTFYWKKWMDVVNHTYSILLQRGVEYDSGILTKCTMRDELRTHGIPEVDRGLDALAKLEEIAKPLEKEIHAAFIRSKEAQLLASIPGIGEVTAVTLVAFLCPIERFHSLEAVVKYSGLCPSVRQSGENSYNGPLVWDAQAVLKFVLIEAQWRTRQNEKRGDVARVGKRVARRGAANDGAVAAARTLVRICAAVLRRGTPYQPHAPGSLSRQVLPA